MQLPRQLSLDLHTHEPETALHGVPIDTTFPTEDANQLARLESFNKHLYRPNTYLHKWWARRCGTTFRYILKQLVTHPGKNNFYEPGGLDGKVIFDPMMGGGTTLHEAIRMGANVVGVDIDPIPVLQAKASLNWIPVHRKKQAFQQFFSALRESLVSFLRTSCPDCHQDTTESRQIKGEIQFVLYGLRRKCTCREALFVDSLTLRQESSGQEIRLCPTCGTIHGLAGHDCSARYLLDQETSEPTILTKGTRHCELCQSPFEDLLDISFRDRYRPLVVVGDCPDHGQFFKSLDAYDWKTIQEAKKVALSLDFGDLDAFSVLPGPKSNDLLRRKVDIFLELFTPRQLLYLHYAHNLLQQFDATEQLWLSLLISTSLEFNALLCGYKGADKRRPGAIRHVFSHHAYSFPYTALENNPVFLSPTSGTLQRLFRDRIVRAAKWAAEPVERQLSGAKQTKVKLRGEVDGGHPVASLDDMNIGSRKFLILQGDSGEVDIPAKSVDFVVTDPPYYDSVQYSDLSNFFRVWLRYFLPDEADWRYDQRASAVSEGDITGHHKYADALARIWQKCHHALKQEQGRLVFTFHHWNPDAWTELTLSLRRAKFVLVNRYVVFSENPISVHIRTLKALKHDTILVLRPRDSNENSKSAWSRPTSINIADSYQFCLDCGSALGWFLSAPLSEAEIRQGWKSLIERNGDGEASE